jgi:hypothetical protein
MASKQEPSRQKRFEPSLHLLRTEVREGEGISLVFASSAGEVSWLLEHTTVAEFFALLLNGTARKRQQLVFDGEVTLEPPQEPGGNPEFRVLTDLVQGCVPVNTATLRSLREDIDRFLETQA